jgi:hypothetical protein
MLFSIASSCKRKTKLGENLHPFGNRMFTRGSVLMDFIGVSEWNFKFGIDEIRKVFRINGEFH